MVLDEPNILQKLQPMAFSLGKFFHKGFHQTKLDVQWWQEDFVWINKWHVLYAVPAQSRLCSSRPFFANKVVFVITAVQ